MITEKAARKCADDVMAPFVAMGYADDKIVASVTKLIMQHVEADELQQGIDKMEAAAPDLLEALQLYVKWCDAEADLKSSTFYERMDMCVAAENAARAAIAKARAA